MLVGNSVFLCPGYGLIRRSDLKHGISALPGCFKGGACNLYGTDGRVVGHGFGLPF
ncbi:hypothetical protein SDC9_207800 [bioreactor metagenome]|uniref:Uncharacterized protein n=1 Tax=bioreactor metagenome TaxID=1076179 RepID=A0A645J9K0_9ZZZZ